MFEFGLGLLEHLVRLTLGYFHYPPPEWFQSFRGESSHYAFDFTRFSKPAIEEELKRPILPPPPFENPGYGPASNEGKIEKGSLLGIHPLFTSTKVKF